MKCRLIIAWIKYRGGISDVLSPEKPTLTPWCRASLRDMYQMPAGCKALGWVLGGTQGGLRRFGAKKELSFPRTTLSLFQLPLLESFFSLALFSIPLYKEPLTRRDWNLIYHVAERGPEVLLVYRQRLREEVIISWEWPNPQVVQLVLKSLSPVSAFFTF